MDTELLTTGEAAEFLGLRPSTLENWRWSGGGPVFIKLGGRVRYRIADLNAHIATCMRRSTSGASGTE